MRIASTNGSRQGSDRFVDQCLIFAVIDCDGMHPGMPSTTSSVGRPVGNILSNLEENLKYSLNCVVERFWLLLYASCVIGSEAGAGRITLG